MNTAVRTSFLASTGLLAAISVQADAILTCTAPSYSQTQEGSTLNCTFPAYESTLPDSPPPTPLIFNGTETLSASGNQISAVAQLWVLQQPENIGGPFPQQFSFTWNNGLAVSNNNSDVWDVSVQVIGGGYGSTGTQSFQMNQYSVVPYVPCDVNSFCPTTTGTLTNLGSNVNVSFVGDFGLTYSGEPSHYNANSDTFSVAETITRYEADGVTPDPFILTPEPASMGLLLIGVIGLSAIRRRRQ